MAGVIESVEQVRQLIREYEGEPQDFQLAVPLHTPLLLHGAPVPLAIAMAVITDEILAKNWLPDGFSDRGNVRHYRYT